MKDDIVDPCSLFPLGLGFHSAFITHYLNRNRRVVEGEMATMPVPLPLQRKYVNVCVYLNVKNIDSVPSMINNHSNSLVPILYG